MNAMHISFMHSIEFQKKVEELSNDTIFVSIRPNSLLGPVTIGVIKRNVPPQKSGYTSTLEPYHCEYE
jgi:hypothetical protein